MSKDNLYYNLPAHTNYEPLITIADIDYKNLYNPVSHKPQNGNCDLTIDFIKKIFGSKIIEHNGEAIQTYEIGLDYIQLLWQYPTQRLPILGFTSCFINSGKTTYVNWLKDIFELNITNFSDINCKRHYKRSLPITHWGTKLICFNDDFDGSKKQLEKMKEIASSYKVKIDRIGYDAFQIDCYTKIHFSVNNLLHKGIESKSHLSSVFEDSAWIVYCNSTLDIQDLQDKLKAEIPYFLHFLQNRKLRTKEESRLWFHPDLIK